MLVTIIILTILSAILYRLGGWGQPGRDKYPNLPDWLFDTKARDIGCTICSIIGFMVIGLTDAPWWTHLVVFGLTFASLTTYWDWLFKYDEFFFHGFAIGASCFIYGIFVPDFWLGFIIRLVAVTAAMGLISLLSDNDVVEEMGRGSVITASIPLLLI